MVLCIIGIVVFGVLGIFSAKYRSYARQSFDCIFRTVTLRPCESDFDRRLKMGIVAKLSKRSTKLSSFIYKNYTLLSWIFVIATITSFVVVINTAYNLVVYGTCDPSASFCVITEIVK